MKNMEQKKGAFGLGAFFLIAIGAIVYLPLVGRMGYINDDWYLMYDGYIGGAQFFHNVFSIDRPMRGYLMQYAFTLFGMNPLHYHLSAFFFRAIGAAALFWLCERLWQNRRVYNWLAALIFFVYPGFLSQVNPIDYQSQIFSLACAMISIALTMYALQTKNVIARWAAILISIALTYIYLGLVEYFLGFEALRFAIIGAIYLRQTEKPLMARFKSALAATFPFFGGVGGFLIWRLFFFESERKATDIGLQLSSLSSPLGIFRQVNSLFQDVFNVVVSAWTTPLNLFSFPLRARDALTGLGWTAAAIVVLIFFLRRNDNHESAPSATNGREQMTLALIAIIAGLIPVVLANRFVDFVYYSRYTLASSVGVGILFAFVIENIGARSARFALSAFLLGIATFTHYGNAVGVANITEATNRFWRQVAWRAPQIQEGVTLVASIPGVALAEDYFVWGPSNFIYYPEKQNENPLRIKLPAAVLNGDTASQIVSGGGDEQSLRRGNYVARDFKNILAITQSSANSCVRFINGDSPELNSYDNGRIIMIAPSSNLDAVLADGDSPIVPTEVFGKEPLHEWCYYYQKADLARQRGEWKKVLALLNEALDKGYYPNDKMEWMPFMQAYAIYGEVEKVRELLKIVLGDKFYRTQTCASMTRLMEKETLDANIIALIEKEICN